MSHKGRPARSGHYIAHIRIEMGGGGADEGSLFFNDEKVAKAERGTMRELKALAHLYAHAPHQLLFQAFQPLLQHFTAALSNNCSSLVVMRLLGVKSRIY
ncbi:hypothetical protein BU17DRAFT_100286 [Hysterangium stoloniferum]|nr:hypothetical protein BU17DRAFT_100286 [Hysterangium stoloniferum]